jgi:intracellular septation protein
MKLEVLAHWNGLGATKSGAIRCGHGARRCRYHTRPRPAPSLQPVENIRMQQLIELAPLVVFFIAWKFFDIYVATAVLMVAMLLLVAWDWLRTREVPKMHLVSAILVWIFGAATLILHDVRFIQMKPTILYWLIALVLGGSIWIGKMTLLERLMSSTIPADHKVPPATWRNASLVSALFYAALGGVNLWVAHTMSEEQWVFFKTWLTIPVVFVFTAGILFWVLRGYESKDDPKDEPPQASA